MELLRKYNLSFIGNGARILITEDGGPLKEKIPEYIKEIVLLKHIVEDYEFQDNVMYISKDMPECINNDGMWHKINFPSRNIYYKIPHNSIKNEDNFKLFHNLYVKFNLKFIELKDTLYRFKIDKILLYGHQVDGNMFLLYNDEHIVIFNTEDPDNISLSLHFFRGVENMLYDTSYFYKMKMFKLWGKELCYMYTNINEFIDFLNGDVYIHVFQEVLSLIKSIDRIMFVRECEDKSCEYNTIYNDEFIEDTDFEVDKVYDYFVRVDRSNTSYISRDYRDEYKIFSRKIDTSML